MIVAGLVCLNNNNIKSIYQALEYVGFKVVIIRKKQKLEKFDCLIIPGVGSYKNSKKKLDAIDITSEIIKFSKKKIILGICMGMQLMLSEGEEGGGTKGLNLIKGKVKPLNKKKKIQIGWKNVEITKRYNNLVGEEHKTFYFMHAYYCNLNDKKYIFLETLFNNKKYCCGFRHGNVIGVQFHPEKSGKNGLLFLENFKKEIKSSKKI
jgi:glutamine amidotransferase